MRITKYAMKMDEDRINCLVKEKSINYDVTLGYIDSPEKAADLINKVFDAVNLSEEFFWLITLNGARKVSGVFEVSHGTINGAPVHPREIFARAMLAGAASIIVAHNHPSGNTSISEQDREVSRRLREAGDLLGIRLDDHIIVAGTDYVSAM